MVFYLTEFIKLFLLFLIGISGIVSMLIDNYNPIYFTSPAPSIFTYQKKYKTKIYFDRYQGEEKLDSIEFNRSFYQNLSGPHRYKVAFNSLINRGGRLVRRPDYEKFVQFFMCRYNVSDLEKITKIIVKTKKQTLRTFECHD